MNIFNDLTCCSTASASADVELDAVVQVDVVSAAMCPALALTATELATVTVKLSDDITASLSAPGRSNLDLVPLELTDKHSLTLSVTTVLVTAADTDLDISVADDVCRDDVTTEQLSSTVPACDVTFECTDGNSMSAEVDVTLVLPVLTREVMFGTLVTIGTDETQLVVNTLPAMLLVHLPADEAASSATEAATVQGGEEIDTIAAVDELEESTKLLAVDGTLARINLGRPDIVWLAGCTILPTAGAVVRCTMMLAGNFGRICRDRLDSPLGNLVASGRGIAVNRNVPAFNGGRIVVLGILTEETDGAVCG